jgi:hypothetical protein
MFVSDSVALCRWFSPGTLVSPWPGGYIIDGTVFKDRILLDHSQKTFDFGIKGEQTIQHTII